MPQQLLAVTARSVSICLVLLAGLCSFRMLAEAWTKPLGGAAALAFVLAAAICLCPGSLRDWLRTDQRQQSWSGLATGAIWWCAGLVIAHQIQTGPPASWILWLPLLAAEAWSRHNWNGAREDVAVSPSEPQPSEQTPELVDNELATSLDTATMQQWTRQCTPTEESLRGLIRVLFAPDELVAVTHISFCPPFAREPEVEAAVLEGEEAEVVATNVYPYGARLEVKRSAGGNAAEVILEVLAAVGENETAE